MKISHWAAAGLLIMQSASLFAAEAATATTNPQITQNPPPPRNQFTGLHATFWGAYSLSNPNATFSTFLPGTAQDYRGASEFAATLTYYWNENNGFSISVGSASRDLAFKDSSAKAVFPMQFMDLRAGYRLQAESFFIEAGVLGAIKTKDALVTIDTGSVSASGSVIGVNEKSYAAIYAMLGFYHPFSNTVFGLLALKADYGITAAVDGNWPYYNPAGVQVTTQKLTLVPFNVGVNAGLGFRF